MNNITTALKKFPSGLSLVLMLLGMLIWLPLFSDAINLPKTLFLTIVALFVLCFSVTKMVLTGSLKISLSPPAIILGALSLLSLISLFLVSSNVVEALTAPISFLTFFSLFVIFLTVRFPLSEKEKTLIKFTLYTILALLAAAAVAQRFGVFASFAKVIPSFSDKSFSPAGTPFTLIGLLLVGISALLEDAVEVYKKGKTALLNLTILLGSTMLLGLIVYAFTAIPTTWPTRLGILDSWHVMVGSMVSPVQAFLGVGSENYIWAFTAARPLRINASPLWNARAYLGGSLFFHLGTTVGLLAIVILVLMFLRYARLAKTPFEGLTSFLLIAATLIVPPGVSLLVLIFILLFLKETKAKEVVINLSKHISSIRYTLFIPVILIGLSILYLLGRLAFAEFQVYRASLAMAAGNGNRAYTTVTAATQFNPYMSSFHRANSQIQAALAFNLINPPGATAGATMTQENQQLAVNLLSQAVNEAKAATVTGPKNVLNWEQLAELYSNLIGVAQNAEQWSISSYQQAIALDPNYPLLRRNYAIALARVNDDDRALSIILTAIDLQNGVPDFYIILGQLYERRKEPDKAKAAYQQAITLLPVDSADAQSLKKQIEALTPPTATNQTPTNQDQTMSKEEKIAPKQFQELTAPTPKPSPELVLPKLPPEATKSGEPKATPSPTPEPTQAEIPLAP